MNEKLKIKKSGLRAIDQGTCYDVVGNLKSIARAIERGELGRVTDIGLVIRTQQTGGVNHDLKHFGVSPQGELMMMAEFFQRRASGAR